MTQQLSLDLYDIQAVQFGEFRLKSGILSPIYIDLRRIISYPKLMKKVADCLWEPVHDLDFHCLCGVPYTALPLATLLSSKHTIPMVMRRKEVKDYGLCRAIEGVFQPGQRCLVVEDLITSGTSIWETVEALHSVDLEVKHAVVLIDRQQGGIEAMREKGIEVKSVLSLESMMTTFVESGRISSQQQSSVTEFLNTHQFAPAKA